MKNSLANKILYPLSAISVVFFAVFVLVAYYFIDLGVKKSLSQQLNTSVQIFTSSIRDNAVSGVEKEIFRECKSFFNNESVVSLQVELFGNREVCNFEREDVPSLHALEKSIYFDEGKKDIVARVRVSFADNISRGLLWNAGLILLFVMICVLSIFFFFARKFISSSSASITNLADILKDGDLRKLKQISSTLPVSASHESHVLYSGIEELASDIEKFHEESLKNERLEAFASGIELVAHDLKGPLSSISIIVDDDETPEEIKDILNQSLGKVRRLLSTVKRTPKAQFKDEVGFRVGLFKPFIEGICRSIERDLFSNKKISFKWSYVGGVTCQGLFNHLDLERSIVNLVHNSQEALSGGEGEIGLLAYVEGQKIVIRVSDTGEGIPNDLIPKLGTKGATFGKPNGSGLGLYQVFCALKNIGGDVGIESEVGVGTSISISFPLYSSATNLKFELDPTKSIVIVDDKSHVFEDWVELLNGIVPEENLHYFSNSSEFEEWYVHSKEILADSIGLFDYNLNEEVNGIDLLKKYEIGRKILVTADADELSIQAICQRNKFELIDKCSMSVLKVSCG